MTSLSAGALALDFAARLSGPDLLISSPAPLSEARAHALTFVGDTKRFARELTTALDAGAVVFAPLTTELPQGTAGALLLVENPRSAFGQVVAQYFITPTIPGIADTARVHPSAVVHETAHVGEYSVVRAGAQIEAYAEVRDHVIIGRDVVVGPHSLIKSHAVIGEEGFGIEKDADGNNFHVPHIGSVRLGSHTEIGNFTTVCSGTISPTLIGDYTKVDDHVHVAHNCRIGKNVIITACAELSGSVVVEDEAWIGPNASVLQGLTLGRDSLLGIGAVAVRSIPANEVRIGNPAKRLGDNKRGHSQAEAN